MNKVRVSWTIPAPVIIGFVGQAVFLAFALGIWKSAVDAANAQFDVRLSSLERSAASNLALIERVKGVEVKIEMIQSQNQTIDTKLDRLIDRGRR